MTDEEDVRLLAVARSYLEADDEYLAQLNDPEGYLPIWTMMGHQQFIQAQGRAQAAEQRFRQATGMSKVSRDQLRTAAFRLLSSSRENEHATA